MPDFKELLNRKVDEAKRPPTLPAGIYEGLVLGYEPSEAQNADKTPIIRVNCKLTGPTDDIHPTDLMDKDGNDIQVADKRMRYDFWFTDQDEWKLAEFIKSCGVDTASRGYGETLPEVVNAPVFVHVTQTPDKQKKNEDGTPVIYNNISRLVGQAGPQG